MKCLMVMFDSLNRHMLPPYNDDTPVHAPNFARLAERTATFDRSYVCSMPCMPARRDFHTGRPNFLHRSWGPLEPFDDSVPQMLKEAGVETALMTDHGHYFEDGGSTYHERYNTWQFFRGQEGDPWMGLVDKPDPGNAFGRNAADGEMHVQDRVNRLFQQREHELPQPQTFQAGLDFVRRNAQADNWFCQIETFDPHEPFYTVRRYKDLYPEHYAGWREKAGPLWDWPPYQKVTESPDMVEHMNYEYAALVSMCDAYLGEVLDAMDEHDLWEDTMLVVWTDHGFMLGEHDCWAKMWMGFYEETAHTPFFIHDPRAPEAAGTRREALVQPAIDLGPTLLEFFGLEPTEHMTGKILRDAIADDTPVRDVAIYGQHGGHVNITDGRYVYWRGTGDPDPAKNQPLFNYTLMPTHMRSRFHPRELAADRVTLSPPFSFTKDCPLLKVPCDGRLMGGRVDLSHRLYDLQADPKQTAQLDDPAAEKRLTDLLIDKMKEVDAPAEQYQRLGLD